METDGKKTEEEVIHLGTAEFEAVKVKRETPENSPGRLTSSDFLEEVRLPDGIAGEIASVLDDQESKPPPVPKSVRRKAPDKFVLLESQNKFEGRQLNDRRRPKVIVSSDKTRYHGKLINEVHLKNLPDELRLFIDFMQNLRFVAVRISHEWLDELIGEFNLQFTILNESKYSSDFLEAIRKIALNEDNISLFMPETGDGIDEEIEQLYELGIATGKKLNFIKRKAALKSVIEMISTLSQNVDLEDIAWMYDTDEED
jgi:hypothetical protein